MVIAALTASSVAPAQVTTESEPLIASGSGLLSVPVVLQPIEAKVQLPLPGAAIDPLAPSETIPETEENAEPVVAKADLASTVAALRSSDPGSKELECLAVGIYYESKSESLAGQLAVGHVIANRAESGRFASTYCGVLLQRGQFSFVRGKSYVQPPRSSRQWQTAVAVAKIVDKELHESAVPNALFFHAKRVSPRWRLTRVGTIGNHVFYR